MKRLLILLMALCCTSCAALPAEERAFAVALCVEKQEEMWQVHARIPTYKTGGGYLTVSGKGNDFSAALADLNASAPMQTPLSQIRLLVLSEKLNQQDVSHLFGALSDQYDVRQQCGVAVTDASAKDVAEALKPDTGARLSKAIDVLLEARIAQGSIPAVTLADVIRMGERESPMLMRLTLKEGKIDLSGAYPLNGEGGLLPRLEAGETALVSMMRGEVKTLHLPIGDANAHLRDVRVKITLDDDLRTARITMTMQALNSSLAVGALEQSLADASVKLLSRLSQEGCDVLGLGRQAILHTKDMAAWHALRWTEKLREIRWEVSVQVDAPA